MTLTREQLLLDLYVAFYDARKHKAMRSYVRQWEKNLKENMEQLCDDLYYRRYKPLPSKCFIIDYPKKREIFAAIFRDRIVHHLYFNYASGLFNRTFIQDSYSCIKGRGTHYGIGRVNDFCRKESHNWQRKCYAMHLDIRGYFMHINRKKLLKLATASLQKMASHKIGNGSKKKWGDIIDIDFMCWLTEIIVMLDPKKDCIIVGDLEGWADLDPAKSLLKTAEGLGLPIGNLTSQLFSNVYLNVFDQYMKRVLKCRYYGRYVDDAIVISSDKKWLLGIVSEIRHFLQFELGLELHRGKLTISEVHKGVEFLGAYIKPYRKYISNSTLRRMEFKLATNKQNRVKTLRSVNSYLGIFRHTSSYKLRRKLFLKTEYLKIGVFDEGMTKIIDLKTYYSQIKNKDYEQSTWNEERLLACA